MTKLLTEAFERASSLPEDLQDQLAQEFLEEIAWEARWDETLRGSQDKLDRLAEKAEQDYRAGKTKEMGFDEL
jgi:ribosome biogenesis GTPase A